VPGVVRRLDGRRADGAAHAFNAQRVCALARACTWRLYLRWLRHCLRSGLFYLPDLAPHRTLVRPVLGCHACVPLPLPAA